MWKTVLRRVLIMIPQLILLSIIVFMLAKMMPGDPFTGLINPNSSPKEIARLKQAYGLNDPVPVQYVRWIKNLLHGDLGQSYIQHVPVSSLIADRAQNTFWLSLLSTVLLYGIAIPMGISAGKHENTKLLKEMGGAKAFNHSYRVQKFHEWQQYMQKEAFVIPLNNAYEIKAVNSKLVNYSNKPSKLATLWYETGFKK